MIQTSPSEEESPQSIDGVEVTDMRLIGLDGSGDNVYSVWCIHEECRATHIQDCRGCPEHVRKHHTNSCNPKTCGHLGTAGMCLVDSPYHAFCCHTSRSRCLYLFDCIELYGANRSSSCGFSNDIDGWIRCRFSSGGRSGGGKSPRTKRITSKGIASLVKEDTRASPVISVGGISIIASGINIDPDQIEGKRVKVTIDIQETI